MSSVFFNQKESILNIVAALGSPGWKNSWQRPSLQHKKKTFFINTVHLLTKVFKQLQNSTYKVRIISISILFGSKLLPPLQKPATIISSNKKAITAVDGYFAELPTSHNLDGIKLLENRWNKGIEAKRGYWTYIILNIIECWETVLRSLVKPRFEEKKKQIFSC